LRTLAIVEHCFMMVVNVAKLQSIMLRPMTVSVLLLKLVGA
jgi:hypothetical protein